MNKKVLIAVGAIIIVVVIAFIAVLASGRKNISAPVGNNTPNGDTTNQNPESSAPISTVPPETYTSSYFSFFYAPNLTITQGIPSSEGYTVLVNSPEGFSPTFSIVVQENPTSKASISQIKSALAAFQLKPSKITMGANNLPAELYTDVSGKRQQYVAVMENNGYVYRVDMSYAGEKANSEVQSYYQQILSSFEPQ